MAIWIRRGAALVLALGIGVLVGVALDTPSLREEADGGSALAAENRTAAERDPHGEIPAGAAGEALDEERAERATPTQRGAPVPPAQAGAPVSFREVAERVLPTVVEVNTVEVIQRSTPRFRSPFDFFFGRPPEMQEREYRRPGLGSGVIVRHDGRHVYVLTNNHVVGDAGEISVRLSDEREFEAEIVGKDSRTDLALVRFQSREEFPIAEFGDSDELYVGDWVLAVGNPFGFESTVTAGIVSALGRKPEPGSPIAWFTDYIQTDASINPGNSGGALVNTAGEVVGINTWIASRSGDSVGLGFAVPSNSARRAVEDFIEEGRIVYGWLGVGVEDPTDERLPGVAESLGIGELEGALVLNVHRDSPAEGADLRPGDFITAVEGRAVSDTRELTRIIGNLEPGSRARLTYIRAGEERTEVVRLERRGTEEEITGTADLWPGLAAIELTDEIRSRADMPRELEGVLVSVVIEGSPADRAGLRRTDLVTEVNGRAVSSVAEFYRELNRGEDPVAFRVYRDGTLLGLRMPGL
ncbi:MAG: Do family serine endopeptidase [Spirochaetaceae bacterium]